MYEIRGVDNIYEVIYKNRDLFDFSDYSRESKFYDNSSKKVMGKMEEEMSGKVVSEFIGLKIYSLIRVDDEQQIMAKGVNRGLKYAEFSDVLFNKKIIRHDIKRIQAKKRKLGTCKVSLSCFDDKRYILDDGIKTLAYGHKDIVRV